jgi:DNA mismatch endonuclease (patch repair protein)
VFVHGCYWHRHAGCKRTTTPSRNREFWLEKFAANVARDARNIAELRRLGFMVWVVWECETENYARLKARMARLARTMDPPRRRKAYATTAR